MTMNQGADSHLDDLRTALAQGMNHWVGEIVKGALIAGYTKGQLIKVASQVGPFSAKETVRLALEKWSWIESRRKSVTTELRNSPGLSLVI